MYMFALADFSTCSKQPIFVFSVCERGFREQYSANLGKMYRKN